MPLNQLFSAPEYQRPLDQRKVAKMVAELDLDALGLLCVSRRNNGLSAVIDGAHRAQAVRTYGFAEDDVMHCEVYKGLTLAEEALMFRLRNNRIPVSRLQIFQARLTEGEATALDIEKLLASYGWRVLAGSKGPYLACIESIEQIYAASPIALNRTMRVITEAWGANHENGNRSIVGGLGRVFARYGDDVDVLDLTRRMAGLPGGAQNLLGRARGLKNLRGGTLPDALAELVVQEYNRRRTTSKLPDWR